MLAITKSQIHRNGHVYRQAGFTLIELLVAITISTMIVGFGAVSLNNFNEKQRVETSAQNILSNLILARNYAVTNQIPANSPATTDRVAVEITPDGIMTVKTQKSDNTDVGYSFFSKDLTSKNVWISLDDTIKFTITDGRLVEAEAVNVGISGINFVKNIKIDQSGLIYEE